MKSSRRNALFWIKYIEAVIIVIFFRAIVMRHHAWPKHVNGDRSIFCCSREYKTHSYTLWNVNRSILWLISISLGRCSTVYYQLATEAEVDRTSELWGSSKNTTSFGNRTLIVFFLYILSSFEYEINAFMPSNPLAISRPSPMHEIWWTRTMVWSSFWYSLMKTTIRNSTLGINNIIIYILLLYCVSAASSVIEFDAVDVSNFNFLTTS